MARNPTDNSKFRNTVAKPNTQQQVQKHNKTRSTIAKPVTQQQVHKQDRTTRDPMAQPET